MTLDQRPTDGGADMGLLEVKGIHKYFGAVRAVENVSLTVHAGERFALIGPNGSGKTTFFNAVTGVLRPDAGRVTFDGRDVTGWSVDRLARVGVVRTFQHATVFPEMTVVESVRVAADMTPRARRADLGSVGEILRICRLWDDRVTLGANLPYGSARRLNVAVAVAANPRILLLDEPAAGLNDWETEDLRLALAAVNERGVALVVIDHDIPFISRLCRRAMVLSLGATLMSGTLDEIRADPEVKRVYLGTSEGRVA